MQQVLKSLDIHNTLISVVIPIYNGQKFIDKAVTSIVNQPCFDRIEIILVNDGSSDNSQAICEKYSNTYANIKLINKTNGGVSSARNAGIAAANSKYIAFLDCDDWWCHDFFDKVLFDELNNNDIDIYGFSYCDTNSNCKYIKVHHVKEKTEIYTDNKLGRYSNLPHCSFLYSHKLLLDNPDIKYPDIKILEDGCFCERCFFMAQSYKTIDKPMFIYWSNSDSITHNADSITVFSEVYNGFISNQEWFEKYNVDFNVDKCVCVAFKNYLTMLCSEYSYKKVRAIIESDKRLSPIYRYREMQLDKSHYTIIEEWISNPRLFYVKFMIKKKPFLIIRRLLLKHNGFIRDISEFFIFRLIDYSALCIPLRKPQLHGA